MNVNEIITIPYEKNGYIVSHLLRVVERKNECTLNIINFKSKLVHIFIKKAEYVSLMPPLLDVK